MKQLIYKFGNGKADGSASQKNILGGKGANLAEMNIIGLPVPPGFTIQTGVCNYYYLNNNTVPNELKKNVSDGINFIESTVGLKFGDENKPLLVSVRSGAAFSMPGMMDTILNLGLNDKTVEGLAKVTNNKRFAYDSYRRFIQMYADVVLGANSNYFEDALETAKLEKDIKQDSDLQAEDLVKLVGQYKKIVKENCKVEFPQDVNEQLWGAIYAVLKSWMNGRAITYRRLQGITDDIGTAVNIQSMVFGNMGTDSATGVCFTRDPSTGEKYLYGEYLINAQGEDVVAGIRTPQQITKYGKSKNNSSLVSMEETMPEVFQELNRICTQLENHYKDMQDIEFTVQNNKLWILQTRSAKRSAAASIKVAVDLEKEGIVDKNQALLRIKPDSLEQLLHPTLDPNAKYQVIAKGLPASPGAASGIVVFTADEAEHKANLGIKVILVRSDTSPEDIHGMIAAQGILTNRGGMTSHAAVVARGMGKSCVCGASKIHIDNKHKTFTVGDITVREGDTITLNGSSGEVILGEVPTKKPDLSEDFKKIMSWADDIRSLRVRTNAETAQDVNTAFYFGAEGIGLCRTEHMFFQPERIIAMREMIVAENRDGRKKALSKLLPMQIDDFYKIFEIMKELPVTIRLLDPPLHEFLPSKEEEYEDIAKSSGMSVYQITQRTKMLHETNPMLGHRGCRLAISYPEIYEMQVEAIITASIKIYQKYNIKVKPEIMVPLVMDAKELQIIATSIKNIAKQVMDHHKVNLEYQIGTMIELPRAALKAGELAKHAEFFSFGTNDLTQTTMGMSRDDIGSFIMNYRDAGVFINDPFEVLDQDGVGELIKIAKERGRATNNNLKIGICGEHGGNPETIIFCHKLGLDYVSCSPFRIPVARLAAAQATVLNMPLQELPQKIHLVSASNV